jgi:hypothetical protein
MLFTARSDLGGIVHSAPLHERASSIYQGFSHRNFTLRMLNFLIKALVIEYYSYHYVKLDLLMSICRELAFEVNILLLRLFI